MASSTKEKALPHPEFTTETDSKRILGVTLYSPKFDRSSTKKRRLKWFHFVYFLAYVFELYWMVRTVGEPYRMFLEKADREGFEVMEGAAQMRAELERNLLDLNDPDRHTEKAGWLDWMDADVDEHYERKKREKERNVIDSLPKHLRVPSKYSCGFWPCLVFGITLILHALVMLLQHWSVGFNVWLNYNPVDGKSMEGPLEEMEDGDVSSTSKLPSHARITPATGKDVLIDVTYLPSLGATFEYHRRRYVYLPSQSTWTKIRCRTSLPLSLFPTWTGLTTPQMTKAVIRFGRNVFEVRQPSFKELYIVQLLSPFTVFQLFCVILWMLDDYWQYSAFTLFMILMFEATVVYARIKSLNALKGMGNASHKIYVFRNKFWEVMDSQDLLPGDVISLIKVGKHHRQDDDKKEPDQNVNIVPADILLLRGGIVANEASLTGESVPQMKEGLSELIETIDEELSMKGKHKSHILYAGTQMLQCKTTAQSIDTYKQIPVPPDNGCVCFVLRTGFSSAQGKLVRMIEGSQEKVKGHEKETGLLLLLLFFFALASSSYVLYKGFQDEKRSRYDLLLHCILIVTSVIPPELPMQMALAVNSSLMTLMKMQVFCTEPYRVPIAGKLDACLFDKTGTLTTDELVAVGVCQDTNGGTDLASSNKNKQLTSSNPTSSVKRDADLTPMTQLTTAAALVLAGCNSLVRIEDETTGDPLESASLSSMRWHVNEDESICPSPASEKKPAGKNLSISNQSINSIRILTRHLFSSKLRRMSCVISTNSNQNFAVVKGSPEVLSEYMKEKPPGYDATSKRLAKKGYRVIALAYKPLNSKELADASASRKSCESDLKFAGFISFTCRIRKDTRSVIKKLRAGGMSVSMVTGDALLTAIYVAKEVNICDSVVEDDADDVVRERNEELKKLLIEKKKKEQSKKKEKKSKEDVVDKPILILESDQHQMAWMSYENEQKVETFVASKMPHLAKKYDLAITGENLSKAFEYDEEVKKMLEYIKVFARMTPDAKETVIECLHSVGKTCLMCGDGANDVGALKSADVGIALLSGFGDVNVDKGEDGNVAKKPKDSLIPSPKTAMITQQEMDMLRQLPIGVLKMKIRGLGVNPDKYPDLIEKDDLLKLYRIKSAELAQKKHDKKNAIDKVKKTNKDRTVTQQQKIHARIQELEAQGEQWASFKAMKESWAEQMEDGKKRKATAIKKNSIEGSAASMTAQIEDLEMDELPMVKIGDASIAAPFTSKMPSIRSCVDIIRQGRCTLVTSVQMYQILALNCLISAYSLSVLYLDGVKYGDVQMTAMGILMSISFMTVSRSKPLDKIAPVRPLTSVFHPALFISLLAQFTTHLITMILATRSAQKLLPEGHEVDLDGQFKPGLFNTVVFLVSNVQQVTVFVVNLQGAPFMTGLTQNRPLLWSLLATFILTFMFASESVPGLNKYFQLVPFPDEGYRDFILKILAADVLFCFGIDRLMKFIFCPQILWASVEGTTSKDIMGLGKTIGIVFALMYMLLGNDEQWEEMLRDEGRFDEMMNATNITDNLTESLLGGLNENGTVAGIFADEL